jgi:monoamine oxidase
MMMRRDTRLISDGGKRMAEAFEYKLSRSIMSKAKVTFLRRALSTIVVKNTEHVPALCAALDAWANHIRVILLNNVTTATAVRTMITTPPIATKKFGFTIAAILSTGLAWQAYTLN